MPDSQKRRRFMPLAMQPWSNIQVRGVPLDVSPAPELGVAFMPVFDSLEALRAYYPDTQFEVLEVRTKGETNVQK